MNKDNGEIITKNYSCNATLISKPRYEIDFSISESNIITTVHNLHLSTGNSEKGNETKEGVFLTVDLKYGLDNETEIKINPSHINFRKSSDGLSGGAIADIVIAWVVIIAIISVIAFLLIKRKTNPPVNNTTFVDLKTDSNKIDTNKIVPNKIDPNKTEPSKIQQEKSDLKIN